MGCLSPSVLKILPTRKFISNCLPSCLSKPVVLVFEGVLHFTVNQRAFVRKDGFDATLRAGEPHCKLVHVTTFPNQPSFKHSAVINWSCQIYCRIFCRFMQFLLFRAIITYRLFWKENKMGYLECSIVFHYYDVKPC